MVTTKIRPRFERSTGEQVTLTKHGPLTASCSHADLFIYLGRCAAAWAWCRSSNGRTAVELQSNRGCNHRRSQVLKRVPARGDRTHCCRSRSRRRSPPAFRWPTCLHNAPPTRCCDGRRSGPWCRQSTRRGRPSDRESHGRARYVARQPIRRSTCRLCIPAPRAGLSTADHNDCR